MTQNDQMAAEKEFSAQYLANRRRRRRNRLLTAIVLIAGGGGGYYWMTQQEGEVVENEELVVTIGYGDIENAIPAAGTLQPKEVVPIGARATGELIEILVEVGDFVEEGQIVARIDAREQALRVKNSELNLGNQRNQLAQRELAVEIDGVRTSRPYSISSAPGADTLDLTVKRVDGGFVAPEFGDSRFAIAGSADIVVLETPAQLAE